LRKEKKEGKEGREGVPFTFREKKKRTEVQKEKAHLPMPRSVSTMKGKKERGKVRRSPHKIRHHIGKRVETGNLAAWP